MKEEKTENILKPAELVFMHMQMRLNITYQNWRKIYESVTRCFNQPKGS